MKLPNWKFHKKLKLNNLPLFLTEYINKYYHWLVLRKRICYINVASKWNALRTPFRTKHINDSMFIMDLSRWHQWHQCNVTLEINDNFSYHAFHLRNNGSHNLSGVWTWVGRILVFYPEWHRIWTSGMIRHNYLTFHKYK